MPAAGFTTRFKLLRPPGSVSRIRLSPELLDALGWADPTEGFECVGVFRHPEELLVAPAWLATPDGEHPFEEVLDLPTAPEFVPKLSEIPPSRFLTARHRVVRFDASWTNGGKQLYLNVGVGVTKAFGWSQASFDPIAPYCWGPILVLLSRRRDHQINCEPLSGPSSDNNH